MLGKTAEGLAKFAEGMLFEAYWFGACCYACTETLLREKSRQYPSEYTGERLDKYRRDIAENKRCADCVGLIKGYCWQNAQGRIVYRQNGCPDVGARGMRAAARVFGRISALPETAGLLLWKDGHIGVYLGGGEIAEARGFSYGIVKSRVDERDFSEWFECPYIEYPKYRASAEGFGAKNGNERSRKA